MSHWKACTNREISVNDDFLHTTHSQSTNHEDSNWETIPETAESNVAVYPGHCLTCAFAVFSVRVQLGDHYVYVKLVI